jgi:hypothetical protein
MKNCDIHEGKPEQVRPVNKGCDDCVSKLSGNSVESIRNEDSASRYRERER